jgi:geranylgeranylglycerol-phosphate geranylgeranyltransferase
MLARVGSYLEILRPHNMLAAALAVYAGYHAAGGRGADGVASLAALCALATGAGNIANDIFDADIDRVNKPRRPIPSARLSIRAGWWWYAVVTVATSALALALLPRALAWLVLAWQLSLFLYARVLKRAWPAGNLAVATISASALYGSALAAARAEAAVLPMWIVFSFVLCREMVKGAEDLEGDRAAGVRTLAVVAGRGASARIAAAAMLVLALVLPVPGLTGAYRASYAWIMLSTVVPALVVGAVMVARARDKAQFARVSRLLKLGMFAGLAAIVAGS